MEEFVFVGSVYALGFVGLVGLTTFWLRAWQLLAGRGILRYWKAGTAGKVTATVILAALAYTGYPWWWVAITRVFRCLTKPPCGPNMSSGWIALAIFGGVYALFEVALFSARFVVRGA